MPKKGLSSGEILEAAERLVQERGYDHFSLRELAARLEVKPASLYNHIGDIDELNTAVALKAAGALAMTAAAFRFGGWGTLFKRMAVLFVLSAAFAGVAMAVWVFAAPAGL